MAKVVKYRVDHLGRCALEVTTDENVCRGEQFFALCTALKGVRIILTEAFVDLHIVELDEATYDVLGAFRGDFGLEGHAVEGKVVDGEGEFICRDMIAQRNLPFHFADLDLKREHTGIRELFPKEKEYKSYNKSNIFYS